jgi:small subunit ribosomal protein S9
VSDVDDQRNDEPGTPAEEIPGTPEQPATPAEPTAQKPAEPAPDAAPEPASADDTPVAEPVAQQPAAAAPADEPVSPPAADPALAAEPSADEQPAAPASDQSAAVPASGEDDEEEIAPRQRPEIPGADLIPDIVSESDEFLDAEARAAAEAEAEEAARNGDHDSDAESTPIVDAAIDLAAGARYTATGKRKTAVARVILRPGTGSYTINGKDLDSFFPRDTLRRVLRQPLEAVGYDSRMDVVARMHGGGVSAQAGALRHGISRALLVADPNLRGELKKRGFLTRDPRVKERKKAGLKKARKRPQFSKR